MKKQIIQTSIFFATALLMASCGNNSNEKSNENTTEEVKSDNVSMSDEVRRRKNV